MTQAGPDDRLTLTIIETGLPPEKIRDDYPGYPDMFETLLKPYAANWQFQTVSVVKGDALPSPEDLDAILITGSAYGVYDDTLWMRSLKEWIGFAADACVPMVGICFGHQIIADALGGDVRKSDKGWGLGRHTYKIEKTFDWMMGNPEAFSVGVSHQDQVLSLPPMASRLAGSDFAPNAALTYAPAPIISFQGHPEFDDQFLTDLYSARKGNPLTAEQVDEAIASFNQPDDNKIMAQWIVNFIKTATCERP